MASFLPHLPHTENNFTRNLRSDSPCTSNLVKNPLCASLSLRVIDYSLLPTHESRISPSPAWVRSRVTGSELDSHSPPPSKAGMHTCYQRYTRRITQDLPVLLSVVFGCTLSACGDQRQSRVVYPPYLVYASWRTRCSGGRQSAIRRFRVSLPTAHGLARHQRVTCGQPIRDGLY